MVTFPGCKINLGLHILNRRPDGYHDIHTCFYPVPWTDVLELLPATEYSFACTGLAIAGSPEDNLCTKAYRLLATDFHLPPVQGHLHKIVPMGAGLGGGSADAGQTLCLLNNIFSLGLTLGKLSEYAQQLGSDCAFFLEPQPSLGTGRGEVLAPVPVSLKGYFLVVIAPPIHVSTAEAYAGITPKSPAKNLQDIIRQPVATWRGSMVNDFETTVFTRFPELARIKEGLYAQGAVYASMSGSGSSVFGLFETAVSREELVPGSRGWSGWL